MQLCISAFRNRKDGRSKECKQKIFAAQTPPRKRGYVEDFTLKSVNAYHNYFSPPKPQKCSFCTIHKAVSQNRRATGARMGLVSKHGLVDIMPDFYAMSRCGLRKLYFRCKSIDFLLLLYSQQDLFFCPACLRQDDFAEL